MSIDPALTARLGATVTGPTDAPRTRFEVWAPDADLVEVRVGDEEGGRVCALRRDGRLEPPFDTWSVVVDGVGHGATYRFRLDGGDWLPDPASRAQPEGVHGASVVVDERRFAWTDGAWGGVALGDLVLYELHVGTFTPLGTFDAAAAELPRLVDLGITAVEPMPVASFPGKRNWGYDGVFPSAVQHSYGGPEGLARFVDAAHALGIGVVLDVVYNHLGPEGNVLGRYAPYFTDTYRTPWGEAVNVAGAGSDGVRRYFIENAVGWVRDFHLDGLRLDAVHAIVDPTARPFVAELTAEVHAAAAQAGRIALVTIESSSNDPRIVRGADRFGWGSDAVWNDDFHHALRVALTGVRHEYYAGYTGVADLAEAWQRRWVYSGRHSTVFGRRHGSPAVDIDHRHFIVFGTNHDHVGNTPRGDRMLHDAAVDDPRRRLAASTILLSPFTPMLFMGEEYAEPAPFPYFVDHGDPALLDMVREGRREEFREAIGDVDWETAVADPADPATFEAAVLDPTIAATGAHAAIVALYTELLRLRRSHPVLTDPRAEQSVQLVGDVLVAHRALGGVEAVLRCNFSAQPVDDPAGPHPSGQFDSDDRRWRPSGDAPDPARLGPWSARLTVV